MLQGEHLTLIELPFVIKVFLSNFEMPFLITQVYLLYVIKILARKEALKLSLTTLFSLFIEKD